MSHAGEFGYPQGLNNCVTCHAGKLDATLSVANFKPETCISCHSVDGTAKLLNSAAFQHETITSTPETLKSTDCTVCHDGSIAPTFKTIHNGGYNPLIYTSTGVRYSDAIKVTIDSVTVASNKLNIKFSATSTGTGNTSLTADKISPTVLIGLYGYGSKDFLVAAHGRNVDDNGNGVADSKDSRNLEYVVGTTHPRFTTVSAAGGKWEVTADLSNWATQITDGKIKRAEIAVMPAIKDTAANAPTGTSMLGLNAPSRTFDLAKNAFDDTFFKDIVKVSTGCNTCHEQLATTFHSGDRGGNIKVCRICHEVSSGGSHLELQSRSIDSYAHAIHSFQAFDYRSIDFGDPVEAAEFNAPKEFPTFGILNCESCHNKGMYEVPDQAKSMPGVLSGTSANATDPDRNIGVLPPSVTGPAVRACGGCHRAQKINADDSSGLSILTQHFRTFGYVIDTTTTGSSALWQATVDKIMAMFN
jgi:OmcA/MtrC family decaheme c-type cytochrome